MTNAWPTIFNNLAAGGEFLSLFDSMFNVAGTLGVVACGPAGGTANAITLAPGTYGGTNAYGVGPYLYSFVAQNNSTGLVTVNINGLGPKVLYLPSGAQAASGSIVLGNLYIICDTTSANWGATNAGFVIVAGQLVSALTSATLSNPTGTTSSTYVMCGMGGSCSIAPKITGRIRAVFGGMMQNSVSGGGGSAVFIYGTGTAPANGAAVPGTPVGGQYGMLAAANGQGMPFSASVEIIGLTIGTAYWIDLAQRALTGGTFSVANMGFFASEF